MITKHIVFTDQNVQIHGQDYNGAQNSKCQTRKFEKIYRLGLGPRLRKLRGPSNRQMRPVLQVRKEQVTKLGLYFHFFSLSRY